MLDVKEETAKIFQARRFWKNPEPALTFKLLTRFVLSRSKPDIFTEEIAGSYAQSPRLERFSVVAIGTPFNRSSVPPTVASSAPSINKSSTTIVELLSVSISATPDERYVV